MTDQNQNQNQNSTTTTTYYAVRIGRNPSVYTDKITALQQTNDYPNSDMQVFDNLTDAQKYISNTVTVTPAILQQLPTNHLVNTLHTNATFVNDNTITLQSEPRVLSIQSSVVYGYVGNKASNYPLQLLGFDVDPIHTCQLSNHTGYSLFKGKKTDKDDVNLLFDGLKQNNLLYSYTHILTGYLSNIELAKTIMLHIVDMIHNNNKLYWLCDPVLGDNGKLYMPVELVHIYKQYIKYATVITPNQTEAEYLTDIKINNINDAYSTCCVLHSMYEIPIIVITSINIQDDNDYIHIIATSITDKPATTTYNTNDNNSNNIQLPRQYIHIKVKRIESYFSGTGDLFSALLLAWLYKINDLRLSLEYTVSSIQSVIERTYKANIKELKLIQCKQDIEKPNITVQANIVTVPKLQLTQQQLEMINHCP